MFLFLLLLLSCAARHSVLQPILKIKNAHVSGSTRVAFNPKGNLLASSGYHGEVKIWSVPSLELQAEHDIHHDSVFGLLWLDNSTLVSGDDEGRIIIWKLLEKQIAQSIRTKSGITDLVFLKKKNLLLSGHRDGFVRSFCFDSLAITDEYDAGNSIHAIAVDPNENMIAVSCRQRKVVLLNTSMAPLQEMKNTSREIFDIAFSPDSKHLIGGGWFRFFRWNLISNELKSIKSDHWGAIVSINFSPDGRILASISRQTDSSIYLTDPLSGTIKKRLLRHDLCGAAVCFSPDGRFLASASDDASIRLYELAASANLR
jgi:WD40 repeat protein